MKRWILSLIICLPSALSYSATHTVTSTDDSGAGTLRQALTDAAAGDSIVFDNSVDTIVLASAFQQIQNQIIIDARPQMDGDVPGVIIDLNSNGGFNFQQQSHKSELHGLSIVNSSERGIQMNNIDSCSFTHNYIGVYPDLTAGPIQGDGINTWGCDGVTFNYNLVGNCGGAASRMGESAGATVIGNIFGTDPTYTMNFGCQSGASLQNGSNNSEFSENIIGFATESGLTIGGSSDLIIKNNGIGTDLSGTAVLTIQQASVNCWGDNSNVVMEGNVMGNSTQNSINVSGLDMVLNPDAPNLFVCSSQKAILNGVSPKPSIDNTNSTKNNLVGVTNSGLAGAKIWIYKSGACNTCTDGGQGAEFVDVVTADASGAWNLESSTTLSGNYTAFAQFEGTGVSDFSVCSEFEFFEAAFGVTGGLLEDGVLYVPVEGTAINTIGFINETTGSFGAFIWKVDGKSKANKDTSYFDFGVTDDEADYGVGSYTFQLVVNSTTGSDTATVQVVVHEGDPPIGIETVVRKTSVPAFPNPASTAITFVADFNGHYRLINSLGQVAAQGPVQAGTHQLSLTGFEPGFYLIEVQGAEAMSRERFLIK